MIRILVLFLVAVTISFQCVAQDTLPRFSVVYRTNNRNVISWTNPYKNVSQISIQRSTDSTKNFITILTVPDPSVQQNGFVDSRAPSANIFYRLFIVLDSGRYQFSRSKRPVADTTAGQNETALKNDNQRVRLSDSLSNREVTILKEKLQSPPPVTTTTVTKPEKFFIVKRRDEYKSLPESNFKKFRDSLIYTTKDTLVFQSVDTILVKPFVPKEIFKASRYVFTEKYGNVMITLPDAGRKKYSIAFFEENKTPVFEINEVRSTSLIVDKTNFVHSGWFLFELYEDGKLKEKHKVFIPKDF